ncbi:cyclophilin 8 putative (CYP8) [Leptomonas pyrrhocoris]|uniref:peptidylprolyl isomerase n=1 Tax=Leptomonas pyrrhocoris TaxID=157538 RepID=A0A0N0DUQ0_LEPPY|nr:cyclophilin 8 putative (CYP8) [Leptomonas pyrrhocoris]KPA79198.1 cyclophilin 8 putative (CYP8) [Leptomonas pyrrhocoris]|eukprot:XP_015657637.1 cyclophilin 8 putative (CYP8) [Leptomonas pyrrhocoris]
MPSKKAATKTKSHSSDAIDENFQNCLLRINNGTDVYGMLVVQLETGRVPKACELIAQNIPSSISSEKNKSKQGFYKNSRFIRLTKEGIQTGEVSPSPKSVPVSELESEIGRIPHGLGTVSLCRTSNVFDGSQFFVCLTSDAAELDHLNRKHVVFGRVIEGIDVLASLHDDMRPYVGEMGVVRAECPYVMAELVFASM